MIWILRLWKPLAGVVVLAVILTAILAYGKRQYDAGYQQSESENAKALADWQTKYDAQVKADEDRLTAAHHAHELEVAQLAARRDRPRPRLVCHTQSSPGDVPSGTGVSQPQAAETGALRERTEESAESFDPTAALFAIAEEADGLLANCRHLNQAVHGVPSRE
jgi:hypothetical protein